MYDHREGCKGRIYGYISRNELDKERGLKGDDVERECFSKIDSNSMKRYLII
jgi:hypothetical protein